MISRELIALLKQTFQLNLQGIHGVPHWARVRVNGLLIARQNGANQRVIELFSFLHDVKREADFNDPDHGKRAAEFIHSLGNELLAINTIEKELLMTACADHSKGFVNADITIQTCWDADRLDLGRGGLRPDTKKLCTDIARQPDFFEQAYRRATWQHQNKENTTLVQTWKPA